MEGEIDHLAHLKELVGLLSLERNWRQTRSLWSPFPLSLLSSALSSSLPKSLKAAAPTVGFAGAPGIFQQRHSVCISAHQRAGYMVSHRVSQYKSGCWVNDWVAAFAGRRSVQAWMLAWVPVIGVLSFCVVVILNLIAAGLQQYWHRWSRVESPCGSPLPTHSGPCQDLCFSTNS